MGHDGIAARNGTDGVMPVCSSRCIVQPPEHVPAQMPEQEPVQYTGANEAKSATSRFPRPAQETEQRSEQSIRAESAYRDWADTPDSERKLAKTRAAHAAALFAVMKAHGVSISRLAIMLEVNDRQVRKYLEARSPIPTTIDDALPSDMRADFQRLRSQNNAPATFRAALAGLERDGASPELIAEGHMRLGALAARGHR